MNRTLLGFIKKEFRQVLRDKRMRLILFVLPVIQLTLFGVAISTEVRNVRLALVAAPDDTLAFDVYRQALGSGWFVPASRPNAPPYTLLQSGAADVVLVAPSGGLTGAVPHGDAQLQALVDGINLVKAHAIEQYLRQILQEALRADGLASRQERGLKLDVRVLYNPSMRSAIFMVPGVMSMIVCVLTVLLTAMALAREKEMGTLETLIAAPIKTWELLAGKTLPYFLLGMLDIPLILVAAVLVFDVPVRGPLGALFLAALGFIAATVSIGILISTLARNQQQAMMGGFLFLFPAILLSGIMFPIANMPLALKAVVYANPLTYFAELLRNIMLKGGSSEVIVHNSVILLIIAAIVLALAAARFRRTLPQ